MNNKFKRIICFFIICLMLIMQSSVVLSVTIEKINSLIEQPMVKASGSLVSNVTYIPVDLYDYNPREFNDYIRNSTTQYGTDKPVEYYQVVNGDYSRTLFTFAQKYEWRAGEHNGSNGGAGAVQGMVSNTLSNGNIVLTYNNGSAHFFDTSAESKNIVGIGKPFKEILRNYGLPFIVNSKGYYSFDSAAYHIRRDNSNNRFLLYNAPAGGLSDCAGRVANPYVLEDGFWPFNSSNYGIDTTENVINNEYFGMTLQVDFAVNKNSSGRIVHSKTGEDVIFEFSGDDDVWVFIDNKLVLDIGGLHKKLSGNINLSNSTTYVESVMKNGVVTDGKTTSFSELSEGMHTMKIFYMERAGGASNLKLNFNLDVEPETTDISGKKIWNDSNNAYSTRPSSITVNLLQNGTKIATKTVNASTNWQYTFEDVRVYDADRNRYTYTVNEEAVKGYNKSISGTTITNTLKSVSYSVEYYYDGVKDSSKTVTSSAKFGSVINTYTDKNIDGYKFSKTQNLPLTITENASNNVIKVYYVKDEFPYTVEYYYDGVKDNSKTVTSSAEFGSVINTYTDKNIDGYKFSKTENLPLTITSTPGNNIIKVYYVKNNFAYTVEYYYDEIIDNTKTVTSSAQFGSLISTYTDKNIDGYKLDKTVNLPLTMTSNVANNVIKIYYVKDNFNYTVEYYYDGVKDDTKTESSKAEFGSVINTYTDKNIDGYKLGNVENKPLTITSTPGNNIMKVYYVKDNFDYTVEYYYDGVKDDAKTDKFSAEFKSIIEEVEDKSGEAYKLDKTENKPLTITSNVDNNIIKIYYKKIPAKVTVKYLEKETGKELLEQEIINGYVTDEYNTKRKDIYGYETIGEEPENAQGKMKEDAIEVIYYYQLKDGEVIVKYLEEETNKELLDTQTIKGKVFEKVETELKTIDGYELVKEPENKMVEIKEETQEVVYYYKALPFDMKVEKYIEKVIQNGNEIIGNKDNGNVVKVDIDSKNIENEEIKVVYKIKIKNIGKVAGKIGKVEDYIPEGLEFIAEDNAEYWVLEENKVTSKILENDVLQPEEEIELMLVLRWKKSGENTGSIVNIAKISELTNDFGFEDIDNTNNTSQTELLITVKTGIEKIAYGFIIGMLVITLGTVIVIKRKSQRVI